MNILITGGAGFIGSNLTDTLLGLGHKIFCIDNFDSFYNPELKRKNIINALKNPNYTLLEGDIKDKLFLSNCFKNNIELVIHLAARAGVRPSISDPELYFDNNVSGTISLLETMREVGVKKMLFASSSSVYGNNKKVPFSETDNVDNPISPYAATKKAGELICFTWSHLFNFDIFCYRFFTVYGPRQRPEMAIHYFTRNILEGLPINMFGDGSTKRDYTYIDDIVSGIISGIEKVNGYNVFNLGESQTISLIDLIKLIEEACGKKALINYLPAQPGDVEITYADINKSKEKLDYNPCISVDKGVEKFVQWYKSEFGKH
jgi:UDP-glucuronate 4-epimerase